MIINPPNIVCLLKSWQRLASSEARALDFLRNFGLMDYQKTILSDATPRLLAVEFDLHLGPMDWPQFKRTYQLYLQSIPFAIAREAWGLIDAGSPKHQLP